MVKLEYILVAVLAVLVVAGIGYFAYDQGMLKGITGENLNNATPTAPAVSDEETVISQPVSALTALSIVEGNSKFKNWKTGKTNVFVTDITSEASTGGLSATWAITYVTDGEQAIVMYNSGQVLNIIKSPLQTNVSLIPGVTTGSVIDSDRAYALAAANLTAQNTTTGDQASIELSPGAQNTSNWDVIYRVTDGYYLVSLDSVTGSVLESTHYSVG